MQGTIKNLVTDRGFGFITPAGGQTKKGKDVFFHFSGVEGGTEVFEQLQAGQLVEYDVESSGKGPRAINVRPA